MKISRLALLAVALLGLALPARADTYTTLTYPSATWDSTTSKLYALGIPGKGQAGQTVIPNASTANTWTGTNNFTGTLEVGGTPQSFPASGLLAGTTDTQTLSNKTLASPIITGPAPVACTATCALTAASAGVTTLLNAASGSVATLPAATGTGNLYPFIVSTTVSSNKDAILTNGTDTIVGIAIGEHSNTPLSFAGSAGTFHSIQMPFAGTQPSGGFLGDSFTCKDIATGVWECNGTYQGGVTPTTPYSAATS